MTLPSICRLGLGLGLVVLNASLAVAAPGEPPALNPFGASSGSATAEREDAIPGYVEMSNGAVVYGRVYMTRDARFKIFDAEAKRQREIPLTAIKQVECTVLKEWMEKEWRFKELAVDTKYYTGREYPSREYDHTITLKSDKKIKGGLSGIVYVIPGDIGPPKPGEPAGSREPEMFLLHKRDKAEYGIKLPQLLYVKSVNLGEDAYNEGKEKAAARGKLPTKTPKAPPEKKTEKKSAKE